MALVNLILRAPDMVVDLVMRRQERDAAAKAKQAPAPTEPTPNEAVGPTGPASKTLPRHKSNYYTAPTKDYRDIFALPGRRI